MKSAITRKILFQDFIKIYFYLKILFSRFFY